MTEGSQLAISLPCYDGPFDLLLALIRRNKYSIDALPVPEITRQFLAWVRAAQTLDFGLGGEFVEVASWLVLLHSRSLLPRGKDSDAGAHEELRHAVLDHHALCAATEFLHSRVATSRHVNAAGPVHRNEIEPEQTVSLGPTVQNLLEVARQALEAARAARSFEEAETNSATVEEMVSWVRRTLAALPHGTTYSAKEWFLAQPRAGDRATLLLALLEMARNGVLLLHQEGDFSEIGVKWIEGVWDFTEIGSQKVH